ncbi:enhancer of split mgamma protein-like [Daktulosphaira vitifoliae]|uniref:enhancer of split mgamma protein-like n=1 Tax=Daktulosphaira vitifoliae TaxID=58002 RepID=UPI0021AA2124|nr:enhancer of split mgamma protein-like [Daktulosphaira vitifoliae]
MFSSTPSPISRTVQYRKVTKPLLERKRRARINRCLDELKDLMFTALEAEGENVDKLEKADILEFTVKHLQKITKRDPIEEAYKFQEGFSHCASEACSFLLSLPGLDSVVGRRLVEYLAKSVSRALESQIPPTLVEKSPVTGLPAIAPPSSTTINNTTERPIRRDTSPGLTPPPLLQPLSRMANLSPLSDTLSPKPVALTSSNRSHMVIRPKPTRPFAPHDIQQAMQQDPMWRPW